MTLSNSQLLKDSSGIGAFSSNVDLCAYTDFYVRQFCKLQQEQISNPLSGSIKKAADTKIRSLFA